MLKKLFVMLLFLLISVMQAAGASDIDDIELNKYGRTYADESLSERLSRLENDLFGMSQSGDIESRLSKLSQVIEPNINPNNIVYPQVAYDYDVKPKKNVFKRFLDNVSDTFDNTGVITGYTPLMYGTGYDYIPNLYRNEFRNMFYNPPQYCPYHNTFHNRYPNFYNNNFPKINNRRYHNYRNPYFNNYNRYNSLYYPHYGNYNRVYSPPNVVTNSSVHILKD